MPSAITPTTYKEPTNEWQTEETEEGANLNEYGEEEIVEEELEEPELEEELKITQESFKEKIKEV